MSRASTLLLIARASGIAAMRYITAYEQTDCAYDVSKMKTESGEYLSDKCYSTSTKNGYKLRPMSEEIELWATNTCDKPFAFSVARFKCAGYPHAGEPPDVCCSVPASACSQTGICSFKYGEPVAPAPSAPPSDKKDDPCFSRDTYAIGADGEMRPMASLKSGDVVMDGPDSYARVIVNQHRESTFQSALLELTHANGELALTPDHVLEVDGKFVPARLAAAGSKLGEAEVYRVTAKAGEVINPLTTSGKILTQGGVLATTYPEWVAEYMLSSYLVPLPVSLSNLISYLFPETTQAYYDAVIEPLVTKAHPKHLKAALPAPLLPAAFLAGDLAVSAGFAGFALASPLAAVAAAAVFLAAKARK